MITNETLAMLWTQIQVKLVILRLFKLFFFYLSI